MRHDRGSEGDFAAYLAARWPTLVRTLVLLGAPQPAAEAATRTAMARCHRRWNSLRGSDDLETEVYRTLLGSWEGRRRRPPEPAPPLDLGPTVDPGQALLLAGLERDLDRLTPDARAALVLRGLAGLDEAQVVGALDVRHRVGPVDHEPADEEVFREAAGAIGVLAPPLSEVVKEAGAQRRRSLRTAAAATALVVGVVGVAAWIGTREPTQPAPSDAPRVTRVENAAEVAWWANGVLHLRHVDVELPRVDDLAEVDGGAVYGDDAGGVHFVAGDGVVTDLGQKSPREPLVASDETGLAAWVDVSGDAAELVVYDVTARKVLASREIVVDAQDFSATQARPIALDGDSVYYVDASGEREWQVRSDVSGPVAGRGLVDVVQKTQVFQLEPTTIQMVQPFFNVSYAVPGFGAQLSPGATYVLTRRPGTGSTDAFRTVRIYDARSGNRLWTGLRPRDIAVAATLGPDDEVHYVVVRGQDVPGPGGSVRLSFSGRPYELRTCHIGVRNCFTVAQFPHTGELPVLAR